jgi:hypothetical protein
MHQHHLHLLVWLSCVLTTACGDSSDASRARELIRAAPYSKLVYEVDASEGYPHAQAEPERHTTDYLAGVIAKPGGISIVHDETLASTADRVWTVDALDAVMADHDSLGVDADTFKIHVLRVDGSYAEDTDDGKVLGVAWGGDKIAIFVASIQALCGSDALACAGTESAVFLHETGHLLGLVDNGIAMLSDHRDAAHGHHDTNADCLMHWEKDTGSVVDVLLHAIGGGDVPFRFDAACLADIAAVRDAE